MELSAENISLIMGISSFIAAIVFFFAAKDSEKNTIKLLESINHKTETLDKITTKMLEKTFDHASSRDTKMIDLLFKLQNNQQIYIPQNEDTVTSKLSLYSYIIRTLFLAVVINIFLKESYYQKISDAIIEQGKKDYSELKSNIDKIDKSILEKSPNYKSYISDRNTFEEILNTNILKH